MLLPLLISWIVAGADTGASEHVRLEAAVVVASTSAARSPEPAILRPLRRRLRTLLPYKSYKGVTEYTASLVPGDALEVRLPDGRHGRLIPAPSDADGRRAVHVAIDQGEQFDSTVKCGRVTVFQLNNGPAETADERTFLVYSESCPGEARPAAGAMPGP